MAKDKYLFIRMDEVGVVTKLTANLDDFKVFCHYSDLSDWAEHKKLIKRCKKPEFVMFGLQIRAFYYKSEKLLY
jgi:hypothetical protein